MRKPRYSIQAPRPDAILYLAWEYGLKNAAKIADRLPKTDAGKRGVWLDLAYGVPFPDIIQTKRTADDYAARIRQAIAYQEGRLGKPLRAGGKIIESRRVR